MITGRLSVLLHSHEVGMAVLVPVGDDHERIGSCQRIVVGLGVM